MAVVGDGLLGNPSIFALVGAMYLMVGIPSGKIAAEITDVDNPENNFCYYPFDFLDE